jgi:hypothetical protein
MLACFTAAGCSQRVYDVEQSGGPALNLLPRNHEPGGW